MELIERYVQAVAERLPEKTREDVARELRANIEDMLPDDATEQDARAVLEKMGSPATLANEYRQTKRYLIGPAMYDSYIYVLKIVLCIAPVALAFLSFAGVAMEADEGNLVDYIAAIVGGAVEGVMHAFIWVTVVFVILERSGVDEESLPFDKKQWSVDDLPSAVQNPKNRIDRSEEVASIIFTVAFISIIALMPGLVGWWDRVDGGWRITSLFDIAVLQAYIPVLVLLAVIGFCLSTYKIVASRWTLPLAGANALLDAGIALVTGLVLTDRSLFNPEFVSRMADSFGISTGSLDGILSNGATATIVIIVLLCIFDSVNGFRKCKEVRWLDIPHRIRGWMEAEK